VRLEDECFNARSDRLLSYIATAIRGANRNERFGCSLGVRTWSRHGSGGHGCTQNLAF
jgi:hypothetical protein